MRDNKIVRSVCYFTNKPTTKLLSRMDYITDKLTDKGYTIQTKRVCTSRMAARDIDKTFDDDSLLLSVGTLTAEEANRQLRGFYDANNVSFNIELSNTDITKAYTNILFKIIRDHPDKTFNFGYVFNNAYSSPFFPAASYNRNGYTIGLQSTDLSENCKSLDEWLGRIKNNWNEIYKIFGKERDFLGIDSSVAPAFAGKGSLVNFVKRLGLDFSQSTTTDTYIKISNFIKNNNPKPIGLNGIMFPCLEDFELADEYEKGHFPIERNIYLSLHSGLGVDTYPIGIDESPKRLIEILSLLRGLSNKYRKPLSARFASDGKAKIGEKTDFQNQYLKDVIVRHL